MDKGGGGNKKEWETAEKQEVLQASGCIFPLQCVENACLDTRKNAANAESMLKQLFLDRSCGLWRTHAGGSSLKDCSLWGSWRGVELWGGRSGGQKSNVYWLQIPSTRATLGWVRESGVIEWSSAWEMQSVVLIFSCFSKVKLTFPKMSLLSPWWSLLNNLPVFILT